VDEIEQFRTVMATFHPCSRSDLRPDAVAQMGVEKEWLAAWTVETGPYAGQMAFIPKDQSMGWVPQADLKISR